MKRRFVTLSPHNRCGLYLLDLHVPKIFDKISSFILPHMSGLPGLCCQNVCMVACVQIDFLCQGFQRQDTGTNWSWLGSQSLQSTPPQLGEKSDFDEYSAPKNGGVIFLPIRQIKIGTRAQGLNILCMIYGLVEGVRLGIQVKLFIH